MEKKRPSLVLLLSALCSAALMALHVLPGEALAGGGASKGESCVTSSCHATMGKDRFVHGPAAVGDCLGCHTKTGDHSFAPIANPGKLCAGCHENLTSQKVVHAPVGEGKCLGCHDAHQSSHRFQLRAEGGDLCFLCHKKEIVAGKYHHGPVGVGECNACHTVHQSEHRKLLLAEGNTLCFNCHTDMLDATQGKKFTHAPVQDSCVSCHSPHSSDFRFTLLAEGDRDLCYNCHGDKKEEIGQATVPHKGLDTERKCLACHNPHASDFVKQLVKQPVEMCSDCHDREYSGANGKIANMKELLAKNKVHHGPIQQGDCSGCHNTHGSRNFRMLRENYPQLFYAPYSADNYKLCFMCHQKSLARDDTTTLTGFRNGDQNLHFVHVNKAVKGRTCRACHDAHATNNPKHLRDAVPFAKWQLPVGFKKTANGGTCLPGCHQRFDYDRQKPVQNKPVQ